MNNENKSWHYDYLERPKTCASDDFWGQVRRTVNGEAVSQEQIDMILSMVRHGLCLQPDDVLLDICCGNGRLGFEFFDEVSAYHGIDISPVLIEIAKENFERPLTHTFLLKSVEDFCKEEKNPERFTKLLCYGSIHLFSETQVREVLTSFRMRFTNLKYLFIGAIPDKEKEILFFNGKEALPTNDHLSSLGKWYTQDEFKKIVESCGCQIKISEMPVDFYQSGYRFNAILSGGC